MGCNCGKPKCDGKCGISPAVLQITNPSECVLFHKVVITSAMGNEVTIPPSTGLYKNTLLYYEATGNAYFYSSDGIPTLITYTDYLRLLNKPSINGVTLVGNKTSEDLGIQSGGGPLAVYTVNILEDTVPYSTSDALTPIQSTWLGHSWTGYRWAEYIVFPSEGGGDPQTEGVTVTAPDGHVISTRAEFEGLISPDNVGNTILHVVLGRSSFNGSDMPYPRDVQSETIYQQDFYTTVCGYDTVYGEDDNHRISGTCATGIMGSIMPNKWYLNKSTVGGLPNRGIELYIASNHQVTLA